MEACTTKRRNMNEGSSMMFDEQMNKNVMEINTSTYLCDVWNWYVLQSKVRFGGIRTFDIRQNQTDTSILVQKREVVESQNVDYSGDELVINRVIANIGFYKPKARDPWIDKGGHARHTIARWPWRIAGTQGRGSWGPGRESKTSDPGQGSFRPVVPGGTSWPAPSDGAGR